MLQTEFDFTLPCGFVDDQGTLHRKGVMRRATALDEVEPLGDPRVKANEAYLPVLLLGRVVTKLGAINRPGATVVEQLFASDFIYLQQLYSRVNSSGGNVIETACPSCGTHFMLDLDT